MLDAVFDTACCAAQQGDRHLIREGPLKRLTRSGLTKYYFHLFNDLLTYSEETVKGYKMHRKMDLTRGFAIADQGSTEAVRICVELESRELRD